MTLSKQDNKIATTLYRKPTATNSLLHFNSFHPDHLKRGIPYGQFLRLKRNCSEKRDFKKHAIELTDRFRKRDYPQKVVSRAYQRASNMDRSSCLQLKSKQTNTQLRFVTSFNNQWPDIRRILKQNWNILTSDPKINMHIPQAPLLTARRAQNLSDHLTRSHFTKPKTRIGHGYKFSGSFPCGECSICGFVKPCKAFTHPTNGQTTQQLRQRIQKHLSTIALADRDFRQGKKLTTVAEHFLKEHGETSIHLTKKSRIPILDQRNHSATAISFKHGLTNRQHKIQLMLLF